MKKKNKKKKLDSIPKINRRLFKLWSEAIRSKSQYSCEYCGVKRGEITASGNPAKIDAHHLMNRDVTNCPLKFDTRNGISVCSRCHKFSPDNSFHMNPVVTMNWILEHRPDSFKFVLENYKFRIDLHNREILAEIEERLENKEPLNLEKLKEIDLRCKKVELPPAAPDTSSMFDTL